MRARPELVGGEGSLDTRSCAAARLGGEGGAEGLLCGVAPDGTGFAVKSEDGNPRPLHAALARFLARISVPCRSRAHEAKSSGRWSWIDRKST